MGVTALSRLSFDHLVVAGPGFVPCPAAAQLNAKFGHNRAQVVTNALIIACPYIGWVVLGLWQGIAALLWE